MKVSLEQVKFAVELLAVGAAIWGILLARETLDDQRRLSAYEILDSDNAPSNAKWAAAQTVLALDRSLFGLTTDCDEQPPVAQPIELVIHCPEVEDVNLAGDRSSHLRIANFNIPSTHFVGGSLRNVDFQRGILTFAAFRAVEMVDLSFSETLLQDASFWLRPNRDKDPTATETRPAIFQWWADRFSRLPTRIAPRVTFDHADLSRAVMTGDDLRNVSFSKSNLSGMVLVGQLDPAAFVGKKNYFVGTAAPEVASESGAVDASFMVEFVCPAALATELPWLVKPETQCRKLRP